ncbi:MAG: hypothetical protein ACYC6Y_19005, partial [Thermoguttaceae bacterium]
MGAILALAITASVLFPFTGAPGIPVLGSSSAGPQVHAPPEQDSPTNRADLSPSDGESMGTDHVRIAGIVLKWIRTDKEA